MPLQDALNDPALRERLLDACVEALDAEVASKSGLGGMGIRAGYSAFQRVQPGITKAAFGKLLPRFAPVIEPHWEAARESGDPESYFRSESGVVADSLLAVTDELADRASNVVLSQLYGSLRGLARPHVVAGVARIPAILRVLSDDAPVV